MSTRAYRVEEIRYVKPDSFNLWHDKELVEFFAREYQFYDKLDCDSSGITELPVEALERAIAEVELDDEVKASLQEDIKVCREQDEEWVQYYCF